ncbi:N-acyl-D-amino-acid deacylase [Arthrobacter stackebrandtii]|uniref:N-acyl-D-amino-acid deacylase n=1 Tax=Arthrobacter stackebrandtii TaxID=272161 RepID=A0ABS4YRT5_9MICC|nr:amidohydrolase family protein [Arthrobacter stackebrandtii]MBP2411503.1 N-acyl-D-amino-acid deacylase [Arthrobacter stackebrandtii]PYH00225.1 N-acyl-D-amino-acid deacylase [Arthrobacter stackebrandtii]
MFDLLITNALIVDGTGAPAQLGSIAVRDGKIASVGAGQPLAAAPATVVVDAAGDVVAPGFIDLHSHADFSIQGAPAAESQLMQGVTTVVTGNCGASPFPTHDLGQIRRAGAQFDAVFNGAWDDARGYAAATAEHRPGVNLVMQLGHTTLRAHVLGLANRPATDEELALMAGEIHLAAEQGVRGFTSGLVYAPGSFAGEREMQVLARAAAEAGLLYSTHMRNESDRLLDSLDEAIATSEAAGARLEISHLKAMGPANHGLPLIALERIESAHARGLDVAADVYPYAASSTTLTSRLPAFALDGGPAAMLKRLRDRHERPRVAAGIAERFGRDLDPTGVRIAGVGPSSGEDFSWGAGLSLTELGERLDCSPEEAALRVLEGHNGAVAIVNHAMSEADVEAVLAHPLVSVASDGWTLSVAGDGVPHPRSFGTFARVLGEYVRERGVLTLEEAVRKMTSLPASRIGLEERGTIVVGKVADLVRFDQGRISDRASYAQPRQLAFGVQDVWVGGRPAVSGGAMTAGRYGQVL